MSDSLASLSSDASVIGGTLGAIGTALIAALGLAISELIKRRKNKSEIAKDNADTAQAISEAFGSLVADLQEERKANRDIIRSLEEKVGFLEKRINEGIIIAEKAQSRSDASEHRSERNIKLLQKHIIKLSDIMTAAGLTAPPTPDLEEESAGTTTTVTTITTTSQ